MRKRSLSLPLLALLCLGAYSVRAQQPGATVVYVSDVAMSQSPRAEEQKIAQALSSILELRLNSIKGVQVLRGKPPCDSQSAALASASPQREDISSPIAGTQSAATYQVNSSIKVLTPASAANDNTVELLLDYDLLKYAGCKESSVVHRSEPISVKNGFVTIVQMGDLLEAALKEDSAPKKTVVDVVEITGAAESPQLKNQLANAIISKLTDQDDLQVRSFAGNTPAGESDFVVRGELVNGNEKGARLVVQDVKSKRSYPIFVRGPVGQKIPNDKVLAEFLEQASTLVLSFIRNDRAASNLTDADVATISTRAVDLLCKRQTSNCVPQPALAIPDLLRVRVSNKVNATILGLLGDAYTLQGDYENAVQMYEEAFKRSVEVADVNASLAFRISAAEASYKGQNYAQAAEQWDQVIALATSLRTEAVLSPNHFLQATRSYRFANQQLTALERAIQGLIRFPDSAELDEELKQILQNMSDTTLAVAYEVLLRYKNVEKVSIKLADVKDRLAEQLAEQAIESVFGKKFSETERYLRLIESLEIQSLKKEAQAAYRVARALWLREARNDFAGAISSLEPFVTEQSELGMAARYYMAETLYKRAKAATAPDRADFVRASTLLQQVPVEDDVLQLLIKINHEVGKDKESRDLLEQITNRAGAAKEAQRALALLCIDYLGDLPCAERAINELGPDTRLDRELLLRLASIKIFWAQYDPAERLLFSLSRDSNLTLAEVELFFRVWTAIALSRSGDVRALFEEWRTRMETLRRAGDTTEWSFAAANLALEADQAVKAENKELLRRMIAAMTNKQAPLPDFSPAAKAPATK